MVYLRVVLTSIFSIAALFVSAKCIGNKQMSELNMFDYINGITIGSIAAEMASDIEHNPFIPFTAIVIYTICVVVFNYTSQKSIKLRRFLYGRSLVLMNNGKIYRDNFKTAGLELSEFLSQCRTLGYFNPDDIQTAILEENGKISVLPKAEKRPLCMEDLNMPAKKEEAAVTVISDGQILYENLKAAGQNEEWLMQKIKNQGFKHPDEIFLATCDNNNKLTVFKRTSEAPKNDITQ